VPAFTLKAEQVIYSNIAKLIAGRIERSHQIPMTGLYTVFAQEAYLPPEGSMRQGEQQVVLVAPTIVRFKRPFGKDDPTYKVPEEFWTASSATAYITQAGPYANPELTVALRDGLSFPRTFQGATTGAVGATQFGPIPIQSPVKENTKFMDLRQLQRLYRDRGESNKIRGLVGDFLTRDQELQYLGLVANELNATRRYVFDAGEGEQYVVSFGEDAAAAVEGNELFVRPTSGADRGATAGLADKPVRVQRRLNGKVDGVWQAGEAAVRAWPRRGSNSRVDVSLKLQNTFMPPADPGQNGVARAVVPLAFRVPMPEPVRRLEDRGLDYYVSPAAMGSGNQAKLKHELVKLNNDLVSEMHGRAAFALSCLILVLVGCSLGMMFRSGNFLTAFAVSFVPALLAITLIIAGQQTCGNVPWTRPANSMDPLNVGVALIWSGNFANLLIASGLLWKLWRT
jgi:lipopolysaccharide export system permease protein